MRNLPLLTKSSAVLCLGTVLAFAPALFDGASVAPLSAEAQAQGKSEGKGNGGGNGGGRGSERSSAGGDNRSERGAEASSLKRLNAANSSPTAQRKASVESVVGQLGGYRDALDAGDYAEAASMLQEAAGGTPTEESVMLVNDRMGISLTEEQQAALLAALAGE